jgi:hypothetical protein
MVTALLTLGDNAHTVAIFGQTLGLAIALVCIISPSFISSCSRKKELSKNR